MNYSRIPLPLFEVWFSVWFTDISAFFVVSEKGGEMVLCRTGIANHVFYGGILYGNAKWDLLLVNF